MAKAQRSEIFEISCEKFYQVITKYEDYPDFVDGVNKVEVLENNSSGARVKYYLNLIKSFDYTLKLIHQAPNKVSWELESGDLFKSNKGSWTLKDLGNGKTEVTYSLDVDFKIFAPSMIVNKLVSSNLPSMMKAYFDRAKKL